MYDFHGSSTATPYSTQVNSVSRTHWKNATAMSAITPASCIDCSQPIYSSGEITSQCTDRCVVIACNDPNHGGMNCGGKEANSHCDFVCDGAANCTDCDGFDTFLQCCTDYHSYLAEPRKKSEVNVPLQWDLSLDTTWCPCGMQEHGRVHAKSCQSEHQSTSGEQDSSYDSKLVNDPGLPRDPQPVNLSLCPQLPYGLSSPAPTVASMTSPTTSDHPPPLGCMWGDCQARFALLSDLVGHVNLEHLRLSSNLAPLSQTHDISSSHQNRASYLSCLWRDCDAYPSPESIPSSSSNGEVDEIITFLANHLMHDHLGLSTLGCDSPNHSPIGPINSPSNISKGVATRSASPLELPLSDHRCWGTNKCHWASCGQTFSTCDELTFHLTAVHVGAGKGEYECFWAGCGRNGPNGFSSKQKICRHLQSHTGHRPYRCTICQQNFSEVATLQQHMRRHTQEKPYKCDYPGCGKSFAITGALTIHKRIHNGFKPFKCKFCDRAFSESSNLSKHLRTHTGARPYACAEPGCTKAFARPDQLTRHLGVHKKRGLVVDSGNS